MRILALLVVTAALAGCFGGDSGDGGDGGSGGTGGTTTAPPDTTQPPGPGPTDPPTDRVPMLLQFSFEGCSGAEVVYHPDVSTAQAALPEGYTAHGEAPASGADPQASVQYLWTACTTFSTRSTTLNGTVYGHVAVRIEAPANATADTHWYRLRMLTEEGIMLQLWTAAQYEVYAGEQNQTTESVGPLQARTESLGEYVLQGADVSPEEAVSGTAAYYAQTPSGTLEWTGTLDATRSAAQGSFSVPAADPFSEAMEADPLPVTDTWFHDGSAFTGNDLWLLRAA